jgi:ornithine cyclodeaminase
MRILSEADVAALVSIPDAIASAREAYRLQAEDGDRAEGGAMAAARAELRRDDPKAGCLLLAGALGPDHLTVKSNVHSYPDGPLAPRAWGSLLTLWDWRAARPRTLLAARLFNDHRTAAGFAAAAEVLAQPDARTLAIFGAGKSAPMTLRYLKAARPSLAELRLVGRAPERVAALKRLAEGWPEFAGVDVRTGLSPGEAVSGADLIVTVTTSDQPVFPGEAARAGACVILGGANRPTAREADDALMGRADVYLDAQAGALDKAGDIRLAIRSGALSEGRIAGEIGAFLPGPRALPVGAELRVFKSMGLPLQDVALAERLVARAEREGRGMCVDLEGAA